MRGNIAWRAVLVLSVGMACLVLTAGSASAELLVYEPFDYGDNWLDGQGGALGTTGTWESNDTGVTDGWRVHPEGQLTGIAVGGTVEAPILNMFDGTVANLPTKGGFAGSAGPEDRGLPYGTDGGTGNLDASIGLDPSVTATFQTGTTTWFSYVGAHSWDRNQGSPTFMIGTDPTVIGGRGLTMQNAGNGIGGVGGPPRANLYDVYPHYFRDGQHNQTPGGYDTNPDTGLPELGYHNGIVTAFASTGTSDGVLSNDDVMGWQVSDTDGFGAPNIIVGKIEWDADTGGYDIITVVKFLETDVLDEAAFDALVALKPSLSSKNWRDANDPADLNNPSNKPDLDQSQFDTLNISSLKFFVDELRIGTTFADVVSEVAAVLVGDTNDDGVVDAADYIALKRNMGTDTGAVLATGDLNEDGRVDWTDLQLLQEHYGEVGTPANPVPEPTTIGLLAFGAMAIIRRRRRA